MGFLFEVMNCFKMNCDQALYNSLNYAKNHGVLHFKWVNYMVCELCLSMLLFKIKIQTSLNKREKDQLGVYGWVYPGLFYSIPVIYVSVPSPVLHSLGYCSY